MLNKKFRLSRKELCAALNANTKRGKPVKRYLKALGVETVRNVSMRTGSYYICFADEKLCRYVIRFADHPELQPQDKQVFSVGDYKGGKTVEECLLWIDEILKGL